MSSRWPKSLGAGTNTLCRCQCPCCLLACHGPAGPIDFAGRLSSVPAPRASAAFSTVKLNQAAGSDMPVAAQFTFQLGLSRFSKSSCQSRSAPFLRVRIHGLAQPERRQQRSNVQTRCAQTPRGTGVPICAGVLTGRQAARHQKPNLEPAVVRHNPPVLGSRTNHINPTAPSARSSASRAALLTH